MGTEFHRKDSTCKDIEMPNLISLVEHEVQTRGDKRGDFKLGLEGWW